MFEYTLIHMYTNDTLALGTPRIYRGGRCPPEPLAHLQIRRLLYTFGAGRSLGQAGPGGPGRPLGGPGRRDLFVKSHRDFCCKNQPWIPSWISPCIFCKGHREFIAKLPWIFYMHKTLYFHIQNATYKFTENSQEIHRKFTAKFTKEFTIDFYKQITATFTTNSRRPAYSAAAQPSHAPSSPAVAQPLGCRGVCDAASASAALGQRRPDISEGSIS